MRCRFEQTGAALRHAGVPPIGEQAVVDRPLSMFVSRDDGSALYEMTNAVVTRGKAVGRLGIRHPKTSEVTISSVVVIMLSRENKLFWRFRGLDERLPKEEEEKITAPLPQPARPSSPPIPLEPLDLRVLVISHDDDAVAAVVAAGARFDAVVERVGTIREALALPFVLGEAAVDVLDGQRAQHPQPYFARAIGEARSRIALRRHRRLAKTGATSVPILLPTCEHVTMSLAWRRLRASMFRA